MGAAGVVAIPAHPLNLPVDKATSGSAVTGHAITLQIRRGLERAESRRTPSPPGPVADVDHPEQRTQPPLFGPGAFPAARAAEAVETDVPVRIHVPEPGHGPVRPIAGVVSTTSDPAGTLDPEQEPRERIAAARRALDESEELEELEWSLVGLPTSRRPRRRR